MRRILGIVGLLTLFTDIVLTSLREQVAEASVLSENPVLYLVCTILLTAYFICATFLYAQMLFANKQGQVVSNVLPLIFILFFWITMFPLALRNVPSGEIVISTWFETFARLAFTINPIIIFLNLIIPATTKKQI